jgi:DNA-binding transcriptional ArsR family regulator
MSAPAADTDVAVSAQADTGADMSADACPQAPLAVSAGSPDRPDTGAAVAAARAADPDMTAREIARQIGVSERTVRRHLRGLDEQPSARVVALRQ